MRPPRWHRAAELSIHVLARAAIASILLIFVFVVREALPLLWDPDVRIADLLLPRQWPGYDAPALVWQPVGKIPKYNLVPLFVGTLKVSVMAMIVSAPIGVACAVYVAHYAPRRLREIVKPIIELLAGIPSVVLGFFGLMVLASWTHDAFGFTYRLNGIVAALALSLTVIPIVFTISEDALSSVPRTMIEGALAIGARTHQLALRVTIPAAMPGIAAALVLGLGRAVGETMVVLMASGNASVVELFDWSTSVRTVTATIAAELGEVPHGDPHWRMLFLLGAILFAITFALNAAARVAVRRAARRLEGGA